MARILLLDDDDMLRDLLGELLRDEGHSVIEANDGLLAFNAEITSKIDLMITDLYMPQIDGMSAILNLRRDNPNARIIAMSGGGDFVKRDYLPNTQDFGASAILRKPFLPHEFLTTVRATLAIPAYAGNVNPRRAMAS